MTLDFAEICLLKNYILGKISDPLSAQAIDNTLFVFSEYYGPLQVICTSRRHPCSLKWFLQLRVCDSYGFHIANFVTYSQSEADLQIKQIVSILKYGHPDDVHEP